MKLKRKLFLLVLSVSAPFILLSTKVLADNPSLGTYGSTTPSKPKSAGATAFESVFGGSCSTYECWIEKVWNWSLAILVPLSVLMVTAAAVVYMTAGANPDQVGVAKKMLWGVASGVGLLILARVLMVNFLGLEPWWIF